MTLHRPSEKDIASLMTKLRLEGSGATVSIVPSSNNFVFRYADYFIKVSGLADDARFEREFVTMQKLKHAAPVLDVVTADISCTVAPFAFYVSKAAPGVPLITIWAKLSAATRLELSQKIAHALSAVHHLPTESIPSFDQSRVISYYQEMAAKNFLSSFEIEIFPRILSAAASILGGDLPVVTHGDLHLGNILYDESTDAITLLDFDTVFCSVGAKDLVPMCHSVLTATLKLGREVLPLYTPLLNELSKIPSIARFHRTQELVQYLFIERICWLRARIAEGRDNLCNLTDGLSRLIYQENILVELLK